MEERAREGNAGATRYDKVCTGRHISIGWALLQFTWGKSTLVGKSTEKTDHLFLKCEMRQDYVAKETQFKFKIVRWSSKRWKFSDDAICHYFEICLCSIICFKYISSFHLNMLSMYYWDELHKLMFINFRGAIPAPFFGIRLMWDLHIFTCGRNGKWNKRK